MSCHVLFGVLRESAAKRHSQAPAGSGTVTTKFGAKDTQTGEKHIIFTHTWTEPHFQLKLQDEKQTDVKEWGSYMHWEAPASEQGPECNCDMDFGVHRGSCPASGYEYPQPISYVYEPRHIKAGAVVQMGDMRLTVAGELGAHQQGSTFSAQDEHGKKYVLHTRTHKAPRIELQIINRHSDVVYDWGNPIKAQTHAHQADAGKLIPLAAYAYTEADIREGAELMFGSLHLRIVKCLGVVTPQPPHEQEDVFGMLSGFMNA